jgi:histidinol-phosphate/aromatic aminotransferase/cobyric acid decarboxylase-like protein
MPEISRKAASFGESVIRAMTRVAVKHGAINLSQGFPDFDPPPELLAAAEKAVREGPHQYAVTWGARNFREALAAKQSRFMDFPIDPEEHIVVTCGSTEAMMAAMLTAVNPGDRVIVFSPFYENYLADSLLSGAIPVCVPLRAPDFSFDPVELGPPSLKGPRPSSSATRPIPTGKVFSKPELELIARLAERYDAFVITDEVYEHIVYAPREHIYFASLPGMFERTISCSSLSKTYSITGWRLGYAIAPKRVTDGMKKVHDFLTVGRGRPPAGGRRHRPRLPRLVLRRPEGPLRRQARALPGLPGKGGPGLRPPRRRLLRDGRHQRVRGRERHGLLRVDGPRAQACGGARLELLHGQHAGFHPLPFRQARGDPPRGGGKAAATEGKMGIEV